MKKILLNDQGTAGVEYALVITLIGMLLVGVIQGIGSNLQQIFSSTNESFGVVVWDKDHKDRHHPAR